MSHGSESRGGRPIIFDTVNEMEAAGFKPRFEAIKKINLDSLTGDEQLLFRSLQTAMISYAFMVNSNGALQNMRRDNTTKFRNGLGPSLLKSMVDCGLFDSMEKARIELLAYIKSFKSAPISTVFNLEKAASGDLLEHFIVRSVEVSGAKSRYGFVRTGLTGFDLIAISLVEETLKSIVRATLQYKW